MRGKNEERGRKMKVYKNVTQLIGKTPLLELTNIENKSLFYEQVISLNTNGSTRYVNFNITFFFY